MDCSSLYNKAMTQFLSNFMRKLSNKYPSSIESASDTCFAISTNKHSTHRISATEEFALRNTFIMLMLGKCTSNIDPTLQASICNYSYQLPIEFYNKCKQQYEFLRNKRIKVLVLEYADNQSINIASLDLRVDEMTNLGTLIQQLKYFCNADNINHELASS